MHGQHASILSGKDVPCPACGYDLRGTIDAERCPECGATIYAIELSERRRRQAESLADDCRYMALRDAVLLFVIVCAGIACYFHWIASLVALAVTFWIWDFLWNIHSILDPADGSSYFEYFEYMFGRRTAFDDTKKMLLFSSLHKETRRRLTFWYRVDRILLVLQKTCLAIYFGLLIWSVKR